MDPSQVCCPNMDCPARGQTGKGHSGGQSRPEHRCICCQCGQPFAERLGTPFYRLRPPIETVTLVVTLLAHGGPRQAIGAAFGGDARTGAAWRDRAGRHSHAVHAPVVETPRRLGPGQAEALRVQRHGAIVWMALAALGKTRRGLGGAGRPQRDLSLLRRLRPRGRRGALARRLLLCPEGLCSSGRATGEACRDKVATGRRGRQPLRVWGRRLMAPVVNRYAHRPGVEGERRGVHGRAAQAEKARAAAAGEGVLNTADIERLNGTCRERWASLARRTRGLARTGTRLEAGMWVVGPVYNCCTPHERDRTPAMAAGITRHCWSVYELLSYHVPPQRWLPPRSAVAAHERCWP